jgi:hypothetical protein
MKRIQQAAAEHDLKQGLRYIAGQRSGDNFAILPSHAGTGRKPTNSAFFYSRSSPIQDFVPQRMPDTNHEDDDLIYIDRAHRASVLAIENPANFGFSNCLWNRTMQLPVNPSLAARRSVAAV